MGPAKTKLKDESETILAAPVYQPVGIFAQTDNFYATKDNKNPIKYVSLDKGLHLFTDIYITTKSTFESEIALWDHRLCIKQIKKGKCKKATNECQYEHRTKYQQKNLCSDWYKKKLCEHGSNTEKSHNFEEVSKYHDFICTETDVNVYHLIRLARDLSANYSDSLISNSDDRQCLYKDMIIIMVHLVHYLSPKHSNSIEHFNAFLGKTTINRLIPETNLLVELEKPYAIPEIFFDLGMTYDMYCSRSNMKTRLIDFNQLSPEFVAFFNNVFIDYFKQHLKSSSYYKVLLPAYVKKT
jgi:hypothetical protein